MYRAGLDARNFPSVQAFAYAIKTAIDQRDPPILRYDGCFEQRTFDYACRACRWGTLTNGRPGRITNR
jgi:hypothetical protein